MEEYLKSDYLVVFLDFQEISTTEYSDEYTFTKAFMRIFAETLEDSTTNGINYKSENMFPYQQKHITLGEMFSLLSDFCKIASKPVVLMIDEVDNASNNQVFIDFLAMLRSYYLKRKRKNIFHAVILAGVYGIKNLKLKLRTDGEHQYNSPWNIAADFDLDMSFSPVQISEMLKEYDADHLTGMSIMEVANEIYQYTSGYPYLVSLICKIMDEKLPENLIFIDNRSIWSKKGIAEAVKLILKSKIPLFDSMMKQLDVYPDLHKIIEEILYQGKKIPFSPYVKSLSLGIMFGFLKDDNGHIAVANRIFEMELLNMLIAEEALESNAFQQGENNKSQFIQNSRLDMELVLKKFVEYFHDIMEKMIKNL